MTRAPTRLTTVAIPGPAGTLEGLLAERDGGEAGIAAIVCHPHPLFGGTMHNKVVHRIASTLHELGAAVLRFNFRGVGASRAPTQAPNEKPATQRRACGWRAPMKPSAARASSSSPAP